MIAEKQRQPMVTHGKSTTTVFFGSLKKRMPDLSMKIRSIYPVDLDMVNSYSSRRTPVQLVTRLKRCLDSEIRWRNLGRPRRST